MAIYYDDLFLGGAYEQPEDFGQNTGGYAEDLFYSAALVFDHPALGALVGAGAVVAGAVSRAGPSTLDTIFLAGILFSSTGRLQAADAAGGVPAARFYGGWGGWALAENGRGYVEDLGAAVVPVGAVMLRGSAYHQDGRRYVTTAVPASPMFIQGLAVRRDGALHVSTAADGSDDVFVGGWRVTISGQVRITIA